MRPESTNAVAVLTRGVVKAFSGARVVDEVGFAVSVGSCYGLLGPNGAGKSTTLKIIYGCLRPDAGTVMVHGLDVVRRPRRAKRKLGVAPQDDTLDPDLSVSQNLTFHARYCGFPRAEAGERVARELAAAELEPYRDAPVGTLSTGLRRRLVLARALLSSPQVLVLDEPTRGLDAVSRGRFLDALLRMKERGMTLLLATHDLEEAETLCDRAAIMDRGRVVLQGRAVEVLQQAKVRNLLPSAAAGVLC